MVNDNTFKNLLWPLKELLEILNGAETDCGESNVETFNSWFGKQLIFSTLYNYVKSQKLSTEIFLMDLA